MLAIAYIVFFYFTAGVSVSIVVDVAHYQKITSREFAGILVTWPLFVLFGLWRGLAWLILSVRDAIRMLT